MTEESNKHIGSDFDEFMKEMEKHSCLVCNQILKENIKKRKLCTRYTEDEKNYLTSCYSCFLKINNSYKEMWNEYKDSQGM